MNKVPWIAETCGRCGKPLKTDESRNLGWGPVCFKKVEAERAKKQTVIDEFIEVVDCEECGGFGFSGQGTGYDSVCDTCGGQGEHPK